MNAEVLSFQSAKKVLVRLYDGQSVNSFYCGCAMEKKGKKLVPELSSCGYRVRKQHKRAQRIEWEHVVPAWYFGHQLQCWQDGGRKACKKDPDFKIMAGDMHNLVPAIGEINGDRSNYGFSDWNGQSYQYGKCGMLVDFKFRKAQPPSHTRGAIARAYLYMWKRYNLKPSMHDKKIMTAWDKTFSPSNWECDRNEMIGKIQGNLNPYISPCN